MVYPNHITSFPTTKLFQQSLSRPCAFSLKFITQIFESPLDLLDFNRIIKPAVRSDSKVIYSEVNAQNNGLRTVVLLSGIDLFRECEQEKTSTFLIHSEKTLRYVPFEISVVTFRDIQVKLFPAFKQSQREDISFDIGTSGEVVSDTCSLYNWFGFGFFDHTTSLFDTSDCQLGRQCLSEMLICRWMQFDIIPDFVLGRNINTELQYFSVRFDSSNYLWSWIDSDFGSCNSSHLIGEYIGTYKVSPPTAKAVGIRNRGFL